jgi:predicted TPR repeat methyltransferase
MKMGDRALFSGSAVVSLCEYPVMANPRLKPGILLSPVEDGYVAYDPALERLHHLNPVAALLAELCDGSRSADEIRELAAPLIPDGRAAEIDKWIADATAGGLLASQESDAAGAREFTAAELFAFTKRLKNTGEVQAAYLCGKRTVELTPQDWDAWYDLGDIAHCLGKREEARTAYQKYFDHNPDDGEIEHLLIALRDGAPPPRASDRAIQHIYKNFAASYESIMLDALGYVGPERMKEALQAVIGDRGSLKVLDLGCGSGLAGLMIKERAAHLTGVDLSPEMIELARARNIYDRLDVGEITAWLGRDSETYDLILTCDCLIYFGDLSPIIGAAAARLKPGGHMALSSELGSRHPYHLTDTGRYNHHPQHVREVAAAAGLRTARIDESFLRHEYGEKVMGLYGVLARP